MATPGLKDSDREPLLRPFLPLRSLPNRWAGRVGHVRHSFAAALGTIGIPSIALARSAWKRMGQAHESIEPLLSERL